MKEFMTLFLDYYDKEIIKMMVEKYDYTYMEALKKFLDSETYRMLKNIKLEMWEFGYPEIFDMWECEQITGSPLSSSYLRTN